MKEKSVLEICFSSKYRCLEQAKKSRPVCATFLFSIKISRTDPLTVLIYQVSVLKSPNCDNCKNDSQKDIFFFSFSLPILHKNTYADTEYLHLQLCNISDTPFYPRVSYWWLDFL